MPSSLLWHPPQDLNHDPETTGFNDPSGSIVAKIAGGRERRSERLRLSRSGPRNSTTARRPRLNRLGVVEQAVVDSEPPGFGLCEDIDKTTVPQHLVSEIRGTGIDSLHGDLVNPDDCHDNLRAFRRQR